MATRNRTSKSLIIGGGAFVLLVALVFVARIWLAGDSAQAPSTEAISDPAGTEAAADRPEETVQALAGSLESIKTRIGELSDRASGGLDSVRTEIAAMEERILGSQAEQQQSTAEETEQMRLANETLIQDLLERVNELEAQSTDIYPVLQPATTPPTRGDLGQDGLIWHSALGPGPSTEAGWQSLSEQFQIENIPGAQGLGLVPPQDEQHPPVAVYTIPAESTLVRARGLTALIGRVPIDGQVADPMPFKVLIGSDNLLANGQQLPEVERAIFSGVAFGDATLHCVTGRIEQVTFLFADGTVSTYPAEGNSGSEELGYISDERGYPCIQGQYVSNLGETIGKVTASSFASGLAEAFAEQQVTVTQDGSQVTRNVTGNIGEYALGRGVADGINQWSRIIAERAAQAFDAVVVRPGQTLTVHVQQSIPVDWQPEGRKVRHVAAIDANRYRTGGLD